MNKRIFISSTCFDLIDLRAELKIFLENKGFTPVMSDHHNSDFQVFPDENSIETCLVNLRSCETVIIVLSQRYGGNLSKIGFGDFSATHLEYNEAIKHDKKVLFFVRDRLESDFTLFKKTNSTQNLSWIQEKDKKIFELLDSHKTLTNTKKNNWYWTFKNVIDIKERLIVELKNDIKKLRLDDMVLTGNIPFITINSEGKIINNKNLEINFNVFNAGSQSAIDPLFILYRANDYNEVKEKKLLEKVGEYLLKPLHPLFPLSNQFINFNNIIITPKEDSTKQIKLVVEVMYKTLYGDLISDITEITVNTLTNPNIQIISRFTSKRYINNDIYKKIIQ